MFGFRWLRTAVRQFVVMLVVAPTLALMAAVAFDRGPAGDVRLSFFPVVLASYDPFFWTCARNSIIFAAVVTAGSMVVGSLLGWIVGRRRLRGCSLLRAAVASSLAAPPFVLSLGLLGLWGTPESWPWPVATPQPGRGGSSLESWGGLPLWTLWVWSTLPAASAFVMLAAARTVEQFDPAWEDAARLAGAGSFRAWRTLSWPLCRPTAARAAATIFSLAVLEPGAPLVLGLRRTLAFQIVETATSREPFPRAAIWSMMAGAIALCGWFVVRRWGGQPILAGEQIPAPVRSFPRTVRRAGVNGALAGSLILGSWAVLGWSPLIGLVRQVFAQGRESLALTGLGMRSFLEMSRPLVDPPILELIAHSLLLGLEVAAGMLVLAWLVQADGAAEASPFIRSWSMGHIGVVPPLVLGIGILAVPWLGTLGSEWLRGVPGREGLATRAGSLAAQLDTERNPWILLVYSVGLAVGLPVLAACWGMCRPTPAEIRSNADAAILAGASRMRARRLATPQKARRESGRFVLVAGLAATNLTPALLFTPWMDGRTVAPAVVNLASGPDGARLAAAGLALFAVAVNLAALGAARLCSALNPHTPS
jgi:iron(III) transport system permease protein